MFAVGEERTIVTKGKVSMPVQYKLRKKKIYGLWAGKYILYISDDIPPLKSKSGGEVFDVHIDSNHCLHVPNSYDNCKVHIKGHVSTIQLVFEEDV